MDVRCISGMQYIRKNRLVADRGFVPRGQIPTEDSNRPMIPF